MTSAMTSAMNNAASAAPAAAKAMIEVERINSYYGDSHVLFDVSMAVREREVVALLGRNGAGKSTTLKTLAGATASALRRRSASKASPSKRWPRTTSPASACSSFPRSGAFSAA